MAWLTFTVWWKDKAWPWLKKNWVYVVFFPVGLILLFAALTKKAPKLQVVSTELSEADIVGNRAGDVRDQKVEEARATRDEAVLEAAQEREEAKAELVEEQRKEAADPPTSSDLTEMLLRVGKDVRK